MVRGMLLVVFGLIFTSTAAPAGPVLTISKDEFDFGYIPQSSKVSHVFWLSNTGDQDLKIAKVNPGCGCTRAPLDQNVIPPGDSTRLEIIFSSKLYFNRVVKRPVIEIEGLPEPGYVTISSYVVPRTDSLVPLRLEPFKLDISQYGETVRDRAAFAITNVSDKQLNVRLVAGADEFGALTLPDKIEPGQTVQAELVLKPDMLDSDLEKSFTFEVNDDSGSRYTVPVRRKLKDPNKGRFTAPGGTE